MAVPDVRNVLEMYNYESFSRSESAGKSNESRILSAPVHQVDSPFFGGVTALKR